MLQVLLVLALVLVSVNGAAQQPRTGAITGQVVDATTGRPVSAAIVTIAGPGIAAAAPSRGVPSSAPGPPRILTGADGRFLFRDLIPGSFTITATRTGYAEGASGRRRPGGSTQGVVLTASRRTADVSVRMWKNGAIAGSVIDEAGEPVVGVRVTALLRLLASGRSQFVYESGELTDDRGMYRFTSLGAGEYLVLAAPPLVSVRTTVFDDIARGGRGIFELGLALRNPASGGGLILGDTVVALGRGTAIPPTPRGGRLQIYPPTLYPSALTPAQASVVTLATGEERTAIDVQLAPTATVRVAGLLLGPTGPADGVRVQLLPSRGEELPADVMAPLTVTDSAGAFVFAAVVPGQYSLRATRSGGSGGDSYWVDMPIAVAGEDVQGLTAVLSPPLQITGRSQFEGTTPRPGAAAGGRFLPALFSLEPADRPGGSISLAGSLADDALTLTGFVPGRYRVRVRNSPQGWMFKGAMLNGVDVSETPFDFAKDVTDLVLTFTDRWSGISGTVQGPGADAATVVAFTTDAQAWTTAGANSRRLRSARTTAAGQFGISSLPPGDYYVAAIPEEDAGDWRDPSFLDALARAASRIAILEGEHKSIDLRLSEVRR